MAVFEPSSSDNPANCTYQSYYLPRVFSKCFTYYLRERLFAV